MFPFRRNNGLQANREGTRLGYWGLTPCQQQRRRLADRYRQTRMYREIKNKVGYLDDVPHSTVQHQCIKCTKAGSPTAWQSTPGPVCMWSLKSDFKLILWGYFRLNSHLSPLNGARVRSWKGSPKSSVLKMTVPTKTLRSRPVLKTGDLSLRLKTPHAT